MSSQSGRELLGDGLSNNEKKPTKADDRQNNPTLLTRQLMQDTTPALAVVAVTMSLIFGGCCSNVLIL